MLDAYIIDRMREEQERRDRLSWDRQIRIDDSMARDEWLRRQEREQRERDRREAPSRGVVIVEF